MRRSARRRARQAAGVGLVIAASAGVGWLWWQRPAPEPAPAERVSGAGRWTAAAPTESKPPGAAARCAGCDVVLVTACSLRRDHVDAYGDTDGLTPRLDALVEGGFRFDQAWSASNFTLAGLTAVLTGRFGSSTGVTGWDKGLVADVPTLPEVLGLYGYRTAAFTIDAPSGFRPDYGLDRGFQTMEIIAPPRDTPDGAHSGEPLEGGGATARPAAAWIAAQPADTPIFVMMHTRTAHYPFVLEDDPSDSTGVSTLLWESGETARPAAAMPGTAGGTAQRGVVALPGEDPVQAGVRRAGAAGLAVWRRRYREAVGRMDEDFGVLQAALVARGRLDRTVVVVLADHGESLGDHGEMLHGDAYYAGVTHIPLLVRVPGMAGRPVDALASQVDVLPTVFDLVGVVPPAGIDGRSLLPVLDGRVDAVRGATLVEGGVSWRQDDHLRGALIAPPWALLKQDRGCGGSAAPAPGEPATCLFDLAADPAQDHDVARDHPDVVADLLGRWRGFLEARREGAAVPLDPAFVEALKRTGYDFRPQAP